MHVRGSSSQELVFNYDEIVAVEIRKYSTVVTIDTSVRGFGQVVLHLLSAACALAGHDKETMQKIYNILVAKDPSYKIVNKE